MNRGADAARESEIVTRGAAIGKHRGFYAVKFPFAAKSYGIVNTYGRFNRYGFASVDVVVYSYGNLQVIERGGAFIVAVDFVTLANEIQPCFKIERQGFI